ncbi:MAG: eCIS core domain-containing protein [Rhodanobacter sp.]
MAEHMNPVARKSARTSAPVRPLDRRTAVQISKPGDAHEREADRVAAQVMQAHHVRAGAAPQISPVGASRTDAGQAQRSDSSRQASDFVPSTGAPLDPDTRGFMERRFKHDLSWVRVHTDAAAAAAASSVQAQAYTLGPHLVFGGGKYAPQTGPGRHLLAHELTHAIQQARAPAKPTGLIQRVGLFESIARIFGGGSFSSDELGFYLDALEATGKIQDKIDSDNKARAVVEQGLHAGQPLAIRVLLIREMLSGFTSGDDEASILRILKDATAIEREKIIEQIGTEVLVDSFSGDNLDHLYGLLAQSSRGRREPVSTEWYVAYSTHGAEDLQSRKAALVVDELQFQPAGSLDVTRVISEAVSHAPASGAPVSVGNAKAHPRDIGGEGYMLFHMAGGAASAAFNTHAKYPAITRDKHRVTAKLDLGYEREQVGQATHSTTSELGKVDERGTDQRDIDSNAVTVGARSEQTKAHTAGVGGAVAVDESATASKELGSTKTTTTSVSLSGSLTASVGLKAGLTAGAKVSGKLLGSLLLLAGPEGAALYGVLMTVGALDDTELTVGLSGESHFTLTGQLTGTVARTWSEIQTEKQSFGAAASVKREANASRVDADSELSGVDVKRTQQDSKESGSSQKSSTSLRDGETTSRTTNEFQAVVKSVDLSFHVD